jgi:hypothetical protein
MANAKQDYSSLRIFASPQGIAILDAKRNAVPGIISADISLRPGKPTLMRLNMVCGHFDVVGAPVFAVVDPATGQPRAVKQITFADGTVFDAPPLPQVEPIAAAAPQAAPKGNGADPDPAPVDKPPDAE